VSKHANKTVLKERESFAFCLSLINFSSPEDVCKLCSVTVSATGGLLLVVVVVGRREEVAEDELGHVDALQALVV
jgi:hypothetical protein